MPVSATAKWPPASSTHQRIVIAPSTGVYFAALSTRFANAEWMSRSSPSSPAGESSWLRRTIPHMSFLIIL